MPDSNLIFDKKRTYLKAIENSIGSKIFNSNFVFDKRDGKIKDVTNDGEKSCAYFVSGLLVLFQLMDRPHSTVQTVCKKLEESGWKNVEGGYQSGDVIVYEIRKAKNGRILSDHEHVGFFLEGDYVVSTSKSKKKVIKHHLTYGNHEDGSPKRKVDFAYRYPFNKKEESWQKKKEMSMPN